jgi:anti-anti-sigma factor
LNAGVGVDRQLPRFDDRSTGLIGTVHLAPDAVAIVGELDSASGPQLARVLDDPSLRVVDLSGVSFIDMAGLRVLLRNRRLVLCSPSPMVRRLLELCERAGIPFTVSF